MATKKTPSTALAPKANNTNLVDMKAQLAAQVAALTDRTAPATGSAVRVTQDKKFKFPDGTETAGEWSAIVVDFVTIRKYYEGVYDANNITPPVCFAISPNPRGMNPSPNSPEIQNPPENGGCDKCQWNQWGTAGKGKKCKEHRKLALLPPKDEDEDVNAMPMWTLEISPTAITPFDGHVNSVAKTFGVPPVGVISEVGFDKAVPYASVRFGHPTPNDNLGEYVARQGEAQAILAVEPDVSSYGQTPAPAPARGRGPAAKTPRR